MTTAATTLAGAYAIDPVPIDPIHSLTIKGITKSVVVDFEHTGEAVDPYKNHRIGLEGTTTVNRKDWALVGMRRLMLAGCS